MGEFYIFKRIESVYAYWPKLDLNGSCTHHILAGNVASLLLRVSSLAQTVPNMLVYFPIVLCYASKIINVT